SRSTASETIGGTSPDRPGATRAERARSARARARVNDTGGTGLFAYHENCRCIVIPVYSTSLPRLEREEYFDKLWADSTKGKSGKAALAAFRKALREKYKADAVPRGAAIGPQLPKPPAPQEEN